MKLFASSADRTTQTTPDGDAFLASNVAPKMPAQPSHSEPSIAPRMRLYFACLSCLGGVVLAGGQDEWALPILAVFFAAMGYICVDSLKLFSLPAILAYAAMAMAGIACILEFGDLNDPGSRQIDAVATLLVTVQAVMMLQRKTQRVYEQIVIFCLLQLIVAAVFNDAIHYGILLVPIGLVGAWALGLLATMTAARLGSDSALIEEAFEGNSPSTRRAGKASMLASLTDAEGSDSDVEPLPKIIESWSAESQMSFSNASRRVSSVVTLTIAPAVILISVMFFYALPRTSDAARSRATGQALVGFSESVTLSQVGQLLQSSAQALRIQLRERDSQQSYMVTGPLYVRGKVLERYTQGDRSESTTATWSSSSTRELSSPSPLPIESIPPRSSDRNFYDAVEVSIACESLQTSSLFSIAPYHELATSKKIRHDPVHWTLDRAKLGVGESHPRLKYTFGTNAFRGGVQTEWIAPWTSRDPWSTTHPEGGISPKDRFLRERQFRIEDEWEAYLRDCLRYDPLEIPRAKSLADTLRRSSADAEDNSYALAKTIEQYLSSGGEFSYTLNLNADLVPGVDPIEQFLTDQRRGHCQYFASALVMMLRSQDIPARMVVGYCTSEFNDLGGHYVARQLHAHAWVEALIPAEDLPENATVYGQQPWSQYWVRLDATPGGGGGGATDDNAQSRGVNQIFDLAQNFWKDFVVDMDQSRQEDVLLSPTGDTPMSDAYGNLISKLQNLIAQLRSGELGGGALANRNLFSVPGAMLGIALTLAVVVLLRIRLPAWIRRRRAAGERTEAQPASLLFYASAIELIARLGIHRTAAQTPNELSVKTEAVTATNKFPASEPFGALTRIFYDARYRGDPTDQRITEALLQDLHDRVEKSQPVASAPEDS